MKEPVTVAQMIENRGGDLWPSEPPVAFPAPRTSPPALHRSDALLERFNPSVQRYCAANVLRCFGAKTPSLAQISAEYGRNTAKTWLDIQLFDLIEFCGLKNKNEIIEGEGIEGLIQVILDNFGFLKVSEFMLFVQQFKSGKYGRFYGVVDPLVITSGLQSFLEFRAEKLLYIARQQERQAREREEKIREKEIKNGTRISHSEWKSMLKENGK